jgi:hypothetical protein
MVPAVTLDVVWAACIVSVVLGEPGEVRDGRWVDFSVQALVVSVALAYFIAKMFRYSVTQARLYTRLWDATRGMKSGEIWLHRDEHLFFIKSHGFASTHLTRYFEDDFHAVHDSGAGVVTSLRYDMPFGEVQIFRRMGGTRLFRDGTIREPFRQVLKRAVHITMRLNSAMYRSDDQEITTLIALLGQTENIGRNPEPPKEEAGV